ncbi:MAG TPA: hypothetical protein VFT22_26485 [Kofleriaceae bacterium]|nr:hypothetical protein [Kofleriaceae bacterium]
MQAGQVGAHRPLLFPLDHPQEAGLLTAYDKTGKRIIIQDRLRFDGVGEEYEV